MARKGDNYADIAKMLMKVDDVADTAKAVDKTADAAKAADVAAGAADGKTSSKLLENMKKWTQKSVTDATRAASISKLAGNARSAAFVSDFAIKFTAEFMGDKGRDLGIRMAKRFAGEAAEKYGGEIGQFAGEMFGTTVGSFLTAAAGEIAKGEKDAHTIMRESARAAAIDLVAELGSQHMGYTVALANEMGSTTRALMKNYDEQFGAFLETFFDELYMTIAMHWQEGTLV